MEELEFRGYKFKVMDNVYPPSEDSFLLLEETLKLEGSLLEVGVGSGITSIVYEREKAKIGREEKVLGVDISKSAVENSIINAKLNNSTAKFKVSDLFSEVHSKFNYVIFNAPYLGKDEERDRKENFLYDNGQIERFIGEVDRYAKKGFLIVISNANEKFNYYVDTFEKKFEEIEKIKKHFFFEDIYCFKITL